MVSVIFVSLPIAKEERRNEEYLSLESIEMVLTSKKNNDHTANETTATRRRRAERWRNFFYGTPFEKLVDVMDKEDWNMYEIKSNEIDYSDSETECESESETETEHQTKEVRRCFLWNNFCGIGGCDGHGRSDLQSNQIAQD